MKSSFLVSETVKSLISRNPLSVGFLTLTFPDDVSPATASSRFNSLRTNFLSDLISDYVCVIEPHRDGRPHFHLVVVFKDFRFQQNFPFADVKRGRYLRVSKATRALWALLRSVLPLYGFGRAQLLPAVPASAGYLSKYLVKTSRPADWKSVRMYRISRGSSSGTIRFSWCSPFGRALRIAYASIYASLPRSRSYYMFHFNNRSAAVRIAAEIISFGRSDLIPLVNPSDYDPPSFCRPPAGLTFPRSEAENSLNYAC